MTNPGGPRYNGPMRLLLVNGPNLNTLGTREPETYGTTTLPEIEAMVASKLQTAGGELRPFQANSEGAIIDWLQREQAGAQGIIINAGALTHYGIALRDAVAGAGIPAVEVHISNVWRREGFRHESLLSPVCAGIIVGLGVHGYLLAVDALIQIIERNK